MVNFYVRFLFVPFFILLCFFTGTPEATASHGMGADITYECLGGYDYLIRLKFYRDCDGISAGSSQIASINGCGVSVTTTLNLVSGPTEVSPLCPSALNQSTCNGGNLPGVQEVIYEGLVTLNQLCQTYTIGWSSCCRNGGITTLDNPSTQNIYINAMLDNTTQPCNSSPVFNNIPTPYVCLGQDISYNHGVTDADGDVLQFSLTTCLEANGTSVDYATGFNGTTPLATTTGVLIDPNTGALEFTPSITQIGVLCVLVEEFRNGIKIGETVRDMQFVVLNCSNTLPTASEFYDDQGVSTGSYIFDVCNDQSFCLDILGEDLNGEDVFMTWNNGIPDGTFDVANNFSPTPTGTFCWTPDINDVGPHFFTVNVVDNSCPLLGQNTETYTINVYENINTPVEAGLDQTICEGETAILNATMATNAVSYSWTPTTGLSSPNSAMTDASPIVTTTYTVSTEHSDGCITQDFVTIFVDPTPVLTIFPGNLDVCSGSSAVLTAASEPGVTFEWFENGVSIGAGTVAGSASTITVMPSATTTYTVEASFVINNCVVTDTSIVSVGNPPPLATCVNIYVSPVGGGDGSQSSPTDLESAIAMAACNGSVIKIAVGTYNFDQPLQIPSFATLEGGFDATTWVKSSQAGATTINRTAIGNDGTTNGPALIALLGNSDSGFRLQDITITTADGPAATAATPAFSTYGLYLTNCSTYDIVRTQVLPGQGGQGLPGTTPGTTVANGENAQNGLAGQDDTDDSEQHGARGGAGAGAGAGPRGWDGTWGCTMANANSDIFGNCSGCTVGCNGVDGGNSTNSFAGGGGGGGGGGGQEDNNGGSGGDGGSVPAGPGYGAIAVNNTFGGPNVLGGCKPAASWPGIESGCNDVNLTRFSSESGRCGRDGDNGANGINGTNGPAGTFASCFFIPGAAGTDGDRGQGGQGGSGGGGGAGEAGGSCTDGSGSSGGGGGGGGEAGYGGTSGSGGGGSFGVLLSMNGAGGNIIESFIQTNSGLGGVGGPGSTGGVGGNGGIGGDPTSDEVGFGGNGGRGGDGGDGGNGGSGSNGINSDVEVCSGSPLTSTITNFDLAGQDIITVTNVNCTFNDVIFSGPNFFPWDLGAGATNPTPTGLMVTTQYTTIGRKDIIYGSSPYTGFHNISFDASIIPEIITDAPLIANDTFELCVGDVASFQSSLPGDTYIWDFDGSIPGVFVGPTFQNIAPTAFNTPNPTGVPFQITLSIETDCCGPSPLDTIWLYVDPVPVPTITGDNSICDGGSTILTVTGTNVDSVSWVPPGVVDVLSPTTAEVTLLTPGSVTVSATVYYESDRPGSSVDPSYSCPVTETFTITAFPPPTVTANFVQVGTCDYGIIASVNPASPPAGGSYQYEWSNGSVAPNDAPVAPGFYCVTVTDTETGCIGTACVTVPFGAVPNPYIMTSTNLTCNGANDGTALAADANSVGVIYEWSGPAGYNNTGQQITGLAPGQYCVTVTGPAGCESADVCVDIYEPSAIDILIEDVVNSSCGSAQDGFAEINASGGAGTFTYEWSNGGMLDTIQNVGPGNYDVTVYDANGCFNTASVEILPTSSLPVALNPTNIDCFGNANGVVTSDITGGTGPFTYIWSTSATTATITGLSVGTYDVTVMDAVGCTTTASTNITEPAEVTASASGPTSICSGNQTNIILTGSEPGVTYTWTQIAQAGATGASNDNGSTIAQTLQNNTNASVTVTYTITPTGPALTGTCPGNPFDVIVTIVPPILSSVDNVILACSTDSNGGNLDLSVSGGQTPYTYSWDNGAGMTQDPTNLGTGTYTVTITDALGCVNTNSAMITLPPVLVVNVAQGAALLCNGDETTATVTASGGTPGYAYLWDSGANNQNTSTATGLGAGTFVVTVTDLNSCTETGTVTIAQPPVLTSSISFTDIVCFGACDGVATVSPSGGVSPYTYLWNDAGAQTTATATGLCPGTWNVQITDSNGCLLTDDVTLSLPLVFAVSATSTPVVCFGESTGTATVTTSNGTAPFTYLWDNNEITPTATALSGGSHTVTVTTADGCTAQTSVTVLELPLLSGTAVQVSPVNCNGGSDGVATASATGGTAPYTFEWDNNDTGPTSSNLIVGVHTITITDVNDCIATASVNISEPLSPLSGTITMVMNAQCNGSSDGSATVQVTPASGTSPYTFNWIDSQTTATATGLGQGTYPVTITDANGCTSTLSATINEPTDLLASAAQGTGVLCFGESNGSATVSASAGTPPYTYNWDNLETTATATTLIAGPHIVVVTDANGCTETASVTISEPTMLGASATQTTPVLCLGESNGSASVTASGGTLGYTYLWDNSETTPTANSLTGGSHTVVVTDANGCMTTATVTITEPLALITSAAQTTPVLCNGESNGSATVTVSDGTPAYTFLWDNMETSVTATNLTAGPHSVVVTDANGCTSTSNVTITEPQLLSGSATQNSPVACAGESNGSATVTASNGTLGYTYLWDNSEITATATSLSAGPHTVVVSDANGCAFTAMVVITEPQALVASSIQNTPVLCNGESNGSATVTASAGTPGYTYMWDNSSTTATVTNLTAGPHSVVVTDANGCSATSNVVITEPQLLSASATQNNPVTCAGESNGSATVTASAGTPGYTYMWDNSEITATATSLSGGLHTVVVTDANGCTFTTMVTITEPIALITASVQNSPVLCNGDSNGSATVSVSNGTPTYSFLWDNLETTATATSLAAGPHTVVVTDANGCSSTSNVMILEPQILAGSATQNNPVACAGESNGSATVSVSNGTPAYTYLWDNLETTATAISLTGGPHNVIVTDANGCTFTAAVTISEPLALVATSIQDTPVLCNGESNGSATVTALNGTPGYTYLWDNSETTATASALTVGPHTVVVTDANGCIESAMVTITEPQLLSASALEDNPVSCNGGSDGGATVTVSGGTTNYTIVWDNNETTASATTLTSGPHTVQITDMNGCLTSASVTIGEPPLFTASIISSTDASCSACIGTADLEVTGGVAPYTYMWDNGNTTQDPIDLCSALNVVTITDTNGCVATTNVTIGNSTTFAVASVTVDTNIDCFGDCDGVATVSASGGQAPYTYLWENTAGNQITASATGLCSGTYSVTISDTNGCEDIGSVTIIEPTLLVSAASQISQLTCNGGSDGVASVSVSGGTISYSYLWSNNETTSTASNLTAGLQTVVVTDQNGCMSTASVMIMEPSAINAQIITNTPSSCVTCIGTADLVVSGGTPPYNYIWTNGSTVQDPTDLCSILNIVTVTDANNCQTTASVSIGNSTDFGINSTSVDANVSCFGVCDGQATISGSGGQIPYVFMWSDGQTTSTATGLCSGTYSVSITDFNGCIDATNITISEPALLSSSASEVTGVVCNGESNGVATVMVTGGTIPYTFLWDNNETSPTVSNLPAGIHSVSIVDNMGCITNASVTISEPPLLTGSASQVTGVLCNGESNGIATAIGVGGTPGYTYMWDNTETTATASSLSMGMHNVTITDLVGCQTTTAVMITEPNTLSSANTLGSGVSCFGLSDGSATVSSSGGTLPYTIIWDNTETTATATALTGGLHLVSVTDQNGCMSTASVSIPEPTAIAASITATTPSNCSACDGGATVSASGGTPPYTYSWDNGSTATNPIDLCAGINNVTVTDANNCSIVATANISNISTLSISNITINNNASCNGVCDGEATASVSGGQTPYTFNWDDGQTTATATGLCAGIFNLTVSDSDGCVSVDIVTITEPTLVSGVSSELMPVTCFNGNDGSATASATGGIQPYTFSWTSGSTTATSTGLSAGTESVTITDNNGCTSIASTIITQPINGLTFTLDNQTPSNCTACDGTASITVSGANPPYTYSWSNGNLNEDPIDLCQGINTITITDANGCQLIETVNIANISTLGVGSETIDANVSCFGTCDGQATVTATGGQLPYTFLWDTNAGSQTTSTATGLCAGTYFVTIVDPDGCLVAEDITITEQPALIAGTTSSGSVSCIGQSDGTASVLPSGGTTPYSYNWNTTATTSTINGLPAGTYTVTVTDQNGCITTASAAITNPIGITATAVSSTLLCFGDTNGSINLTVSGGAIPYGFSWTGGAPAVEDPAGLAAGNYTVTITDANGCTTTASATIMEPTELTATSTSTNTTCAGVCDGAATVTATGGTGNYTYTWSASAGGQTTASVNGLCAGSHTVSITDANGCVEIQTITITQPNILTLAANTVTDVVCFGESNGVATAVAQGGNAPYTYAWDNTETNSTASALDAGNHAVSVTDANGCTAVGNVVVNEPALLVVTIAGTNVLCNGEDNGSATATAVGGNGGYVYTWSNSTNGQTAAPLSPGNYTVTVTDVLGCTAVENVTITEPLALTATSSSQEVTCLGDADGRGTLFPAGGTAPYLFTWDNAEVTNPAIALTSGIHTVTITDANNCTLVESVTIGSPALLVPSAITTAPTCFGLSNGTAVATAVGGTAPYNFVWNTAPPQFGATATGLASGTIVLEVTDANGCTQNVNVTIGNAPTMIDLALTPVDASCFGSNDGSISVVASGGTPSYTYEWNNGASGPTAFTLDAGTYTVTVTDANGCINVISGNVGQPDPILVDFSTTPTICFGEENGTIVIVDTTITGGLAPYVYSLNGEDFQMGNVFGGLAAGNYTLYIQDANDCVITRQALIDEPSELIVDLGVDLEVELGDSVMLDAIVTPSNIGVTYSWSPGDYLSCLDCATPVVTPFETTTYQVIVTDTTSGCTALDEITIVVDKNRNIYIPNAFTPNEDGSNDVFMIYGGIGVSQIRSFQVYDRWGEMVWQSSGFQPDDPTYGWDGTFKGKKLNPSVFVYYAEVEFVDGEVIQYKGDVTLIK